MCIGVLLQGLGDQRTQAPALWPRLAGGVPNAVVCHHDPAPVPIDHTVEGNGPAVPAAECVLKRICQKLIDHQTSWHGHVYRYRVSVDAKVEPYALYGMRGHHRSRDLAEIHP